eukprot:712635_1
MSTRAAAAANSRRVKQRLIQILFGAKNSMQGRESHRLLDYASYSYTDLRKAYFERVQLLHPDKMKFRNEDEMNEKLKSPTKQKIETLLSKEIEKIGWKETNEAIQKSKSSRGHEAFVELQEAWKNYNDIAKKMNDRDGPEDNFTMFGVGCSFSDNPSEQLKRTEIMDQACRGWFSSGHLEEKSQVPKSDIIDTRSGWRSSTPEREEILDEDSQDEHKAQSDTNPMKKCKPAARKRSLIDHMIPAHKR